MAHIQMFHRADNKDGYVAVIVHREKHAADLKKMGFVDTQEEATAEPKPKSQERTKSNDK